MRTTLALAVATACALVFLQLTGAALADDAPACDVRISLWVRQWRTPALDELMRIVSWGGTHLVTILVAAGVAWWAHRRDAAALAWELVAVTVASIVLNNLLKNSFDRPRPDLFPDAVLPTSWSFPSGHALLSLAIYGTAAIVVSRLEPRFRTAAWTMVAVVVPLIGLSRVYLGVHWPSDVAAGFAAATLLLLAIRFTLGKRGRIPSVPENTDA